MILPAQISYCARVKKVDLKKEKKESVSENRKVRLL